MPRDTRCWYNMTTEPIYTNLQTPATRSRPDGDANARIGTTQGYVSYIMSGMDRSLKDALYPIRGGAIERLASCPGGSLERK